MSETPKPLPRLTIRFLGCSDSPSSAWSLQWSLADRC
jgi:hypothetical protein